MTDVSRGRAPFRVPRAHATKAEKVAAPALAAGLGFIAGRRPIRRPQAPVGGAGACQAKPGCAAQRAAASCERSRRCRCAIRSSAAGPQHAARGRRGPDDEAPLDVPLLRPGVGEQDEDAVERRHRAASAAPRARRRSRSRTLSRPCSSIAASALTTPSSNSSQPMRPTSGLCSRLPDECSPPPKPISSQRAKRRANSVRADCGGCARSSAQRAAAPLAAGAAGGRSACARAAARTSAARSCARRRLAGVRLQAAAFLIASARSVFSQEKPPSASGARPKWP